MSSHLIPAISAFSLPALILQFPASCTPSPQAASTSRGSSKATFEDNAMRNDPQELRKRLTPMQFHVTQENGTEPPFKNAYWNESREGIYVDIVSRECLFTSLDKFNSHCGWPSFSKPLDGSRIEEKADLTLGMARTEVRSGHSHLGHVFDDGPIDKGGLRYCINSAALDFIPKEDMAARGYGHLLYLFEKQKLDQAILAGGCFWGMEELLRAQKGVVHTEVGYMGGKVQNATYENHEGHAEAVIVTFDPQKTSYETLLNFFWRIHDPTTLNRQGNDRGSSYRSAIFTLNSEQKTIAERVKAEIDQSVRWKSKLVTEITPAFQWWTAESHHQDYLQKNPNGYTCHWVRP